MATNRKVATQFLRKKAECEVDAAVEILRAKVAQENLIKASGVPFTIVRSMQFFEFAKAIIQSASEGQAVRLAPALFQPIAADDVAAALTDIALAEPLNDTVEIAGPELIRMDEFARRFMNATGDSRKVTPDVHAHYFGTELNDQSLTPGNNVATREHVIGLLQILANWTRGIGPN